MQVLQAGNHKLIFLELDPETVAHIARQCGFQACVEDGPRSITAQLTSTRMAPLLLFDAADAANLGWFSRCQFYVDGNSGAVLQTPFSIANVRDASGRLLPNAVRLQIAKELPVSFRLPGRQPVTEQSIYGVLAALLNALLKTGVGVCGGSVVQPLSGRQAHR
jgi:hypothetical protein